MRKWEDTTSPGKRRRLITTKGEKPKYEYSFCCYLCQTEDRTKLDYMIKDELWLKVMPSRLGFLCIECLEKGLGHLVKGVDFNYRNKGFSFRE